MAGSPGDRPERKNRLLAALSQKALKQLSPHLELTSLKLNQSAYEPNRLIKYVHFPLNGVISIVTVMRDGMELEAATVGNEGFVGVPVLLGSQTTGSKAFCQVPGSEVRLKATVFRAELEQNAEFKGILLRYTDAMMSQLAQGVACNAVHSVAQRCARWLLQTHDRMGSDRFPLTHEFLGGMLGVRRAGVSEAASRLSRAGLIRYRRGLIEILDRVGLENASCECYRATQREFDAVFRTKPHRTIKSV